jgi:hypothetical protein
MGRTLSVRCRQGEGLGEFTRLISAYFFPRIHPLWFQPQECVNYANNSLSLPLPVTFCGFSRCTALDGGFFQLELWERRFARSGDGEGMGMTDNNGHRVAATQPHRELQLWKRRKSNMPSQKQNNTW